MRRLRHVGDLPAPQCVVHLTEEAELALPMAEQLPLRIKTGKPIGLVDLRIVDLAGRELPRRRGHGGIVVRAPGWCRLPEGAGQGLSSGTAAGCTPGTWLHRSQGTVEIRDHIKDVIKTGGEWISSLALENLISAHDGSTRWPWWGYPTSSGGAPAGAGGRQGGSEPGSQAIKTHLQGLESGCISRWAIPRRDHVQEIPRTSVGKVNKRLIRERELGGSGDTRPPTITPEPAPRPPSLFEG